MKNIGSQSAGWLISVGINSSEELYEVGVVNAYLRVKQSYPDKVSPNLLYALQGAVLDLEWNKLPPDIKADLIKELESKG